MGKNCQNTGCQYEKMFRWDNSPLMCIDGTQKLRCKICGGETSEGELEKFGVKK